MREGKMEKKKTNPKKNIIWLVILIVVVIIIVILLVMLFTAKETHTSKNDTNTSIGVLYCKSGKPNEPFFKSDKAATEQHEIKITWKDDKAGEMSYTYTGKFESEADTEDVMSAMHAKYNLYMGQTGIHQEHLYPTFSSIGNDGVINLFINDKTFNEGTAKLLFLNDDDYRDFRHSSLGALKGSYQAKGFTCKISE